MQNAPLLSDAIALAAHRRRADHGNGMFLQTAAADDLQDRLALVNRAFTAPAIVTPFPKVWERQVPNAVIVPDSEVLALNEAAHDLVIHATALHWANDPVGQLIQCRRALKEDGLFLGATLGGQTLQELRKVLAQAETEISGGLSPRVCPMADIRELGALLQRAGFALPVADREQISVTYDTAFHLMRDLRSMGENNALASRRKGMTRRDILYRAAEIYQDAFSENGKITATFELVFLTGWMPHSSQPQPLRPGSAEKSLAAALGTSEGILKSK